MTQFLAPSLLNPNTMRERLDWLLMYMPDRFICIYLRCGEEGKSFITVPPNKYNSLFREFRFRGHDDPVECHTQMFKTEFDEMYHVLVSRTRDIVYQLSNE